MTDKLALRFKARIIETSTIGPRLVIADERPTQRATVRSEWWLDLPVQCHRTSGNALTWLIVDAANERGAAFCGDPDDLDDLYSALKRLRVNELFTRRPLPFDPTEALACTEVES